MTDSIASDLVSVQGYVLTQALPLEIKALLEWISVTPQVRSNLYEFSFYAMICTFAGPGFDGSHRAKDPKLGAQNVACIDTSNDKGTSHYNCHQNFRMGYCGHWQIASGPRPLGSHGLCPYFYNISFDYKFVPDNYFNCWSDRKANLTSSLDIRMGYLGTFNRTLVRGDIFIATARYPPFVVINNVIENSPQTLSAFENEV